MILHVCITELNRGREAQTIGLSCDKFVRCAKPTYWFTHDIYLICVYTLPTGSFDLHYTVNMNYSVYLLGSSTGEL